MVRLVILLGLLVGAAAAEPEARVMRGMVYGEVGGAPVRLDLYLPSTGTPPYPWLIRYSSGIESKPDGNGAALLRAGYALAYADHGTEAQIDPTPPWPQFPIMVRRGIRYLRAHADEYGLDPVRAGVWGWSRGGTSAVLAAASWWEPRFHDGSFAGQSDRVAACIAIAGDFRVLPGDADGNDLAAPGLLSARGGDLPPELQRPAAWVTPAMPPTLLIRGGRDGDPADVVALGSALTTLGVANEVWIKPDAGHGVGGADTAERIVAWADRFVRAATAADLARPFDPTSAAIALHGIGFHDAARQVAALVPATPVFQRDCRAAEARRLAEDVRQAMEVVVVPAAWRQDLSRLEALVSEDPSLAPLAEPLRQMAAERTTASAAIDAELARRTTVTAPWPADLAVPEWALAHGADGCGAWATWELAPGVLQRFRWCPPGSATMGALPGSWGFIVPEPPRGEVRIAQGFWLADTELTRAAWTAVMGGATVEAEANLPAGRISHAAALLCMGRLRELRPGVPVRLPLMHEWRWAARCGGMDTALFGSGADLDAIAWHAGNSGGTPHPVGTRLANAWGLQDLQGSLFEWLGDPAPPKPTHYRFYAGGSYASSLRRCRPDTIGAGNGDNTQDHFGMRLLIEASSR